MYVTSIKSKIYKFNFKINYLDFDDFKIFVNELNKTSDHFYYCDSLNSGYALVISSDYNSGLDLMKLFYIEKNTHTEDSVYKVSGREDELIKYVANFHTKAAAQEFYNYLLDLRSNEFKGVSSLIRNSVIYYCSCQTTGYDIAKKFEEDFMNRTLEKIVDEPPKAIHPIDDEQKIYEFKEEVVASDNSPFNKIFSIFKGNSSNTDNNKDN